MALPAVGQAFFQLGQLSIDHFLGMRFLPQASAAALLCILPEGFDGALGQVCILALFLRMALLVRMRG